MATQRFTRINNEHTSLDVPPVPRRSLAGEPPSSNGDLSAPSTVPNARKRHRIHRRRHNPSVSRMTPTEDGSQAKRTRKDADKPAKGARKAESFPAARSQSTASTRSNRFVNAGTGSRASARPEGNDSQFEVNTIERIEVSNLSGTGGTGGAGGSGGLIGGTGGNGAGTVISVNFVLNFPR
ncbi:hypothetical protein MSAN_01832200 [Mycena sanguinolenta]|uniref:Uncharacterized protein n=1 Tax=Mycena sanguinolenta TaxID=230812 RepID=A0A8H7CS21_9AGAR|nr:hypothetical protein MSAN_01832200 [Mycena sanguinolenta]